MSKTNGSTKENTKQIYIYSLKCNKNNKIYIGQTTNLNKRILQHRTNPSQKLYVDVCRYKPRGVHYMHNPPIACNQRLYFKSLICEFFHELNVPFSL